jgi:hypothetical protein
MSIPKTRIPDQFFWIFFDVVKINTHLKAFRGSTCKTGHELGGYIWHFPKPVVCDVRLFVACRHIFMQIFQIIGGQRRRQTTMITTIHYTTTEIACLFAYFLNAKRLKCLHFRLDQDDG